jgi:NADH:ubiquinone oxidoreductase subunit 5 (subunit L)/multisubunit Na+/H+ antiporter MnhA subunit
MDFATLLPLLLLIAWLLPLASFAAIVLFGPRMGKAGRGAGYVATGAIFLAFLLSAIALGAWLAKHPVGATAGLPVGRIGNPSAGSTSLADGLAIRPTTSEATLVSSPILSGNLYLLGQFGSLQIGLSYYIDALTLAMFAMVTMVATCIHVYSFGYMHEELHEVTDPQVTLANGQRLKRRGRFHRFYQYLSLFCFSMLGLVLAGNIAMVFVFWELVGICSYLLIGFYIERRSACLAANKAFIVNRVGDFGMIVGLMAVWGSLGTFAFGDLPDAQGHIQPGIFSLVRPAETGHALTVPDGMVRLAAKDQIEAIYRGETRPVGAGVAAGANRPPAVSPGGHAGSAAEPQIASSMSDWRKSGYGYGLLVIAGLGIFCGCVGKSAQFPLHVWLPDAMEGPTPVSALIHAATMVAAGVYLVGRFYPVFTPEVLLVIACVGCTTLAIAATIAVTATDIKRVLAYSTVSQLGYMMLALGVGGWVAGLFHLFTHAFFKALLFLCSGSVIHACGTNEMTEMGGLRKKMPWTAYTMLAGCLAISGAGVPLLGIGLSDYGLSGFYSKDSILAQAYLFGRDNGPWIALFWVAAGGAVITAFYMFRLWYMTFAGEPKNHHVYEHAHESPRVMYGPLVVLAVMAVIVAWPVPFSNLSLKSFLEQARPAGLEQPFVGGLFWPSVAVPLEHLSHAEAVHVPVSLIAFFAALTGFILATLFYGLRMLDAEKVRRVFAPVYAFLRAKWYFDELYAWLFIRPVLAISIAAAWIDRHLIDGLADGLARLVCVGAVLDDFIDRYFVDGAVNLLAALTFGLGLRLRALQSGRLRQYVMLIVVGTVALFILVTVYWDFVAVHKEM